MQLGHHLCWHGCAQVEETEEAFKPLTEFLASTLGERVEKVAVSQRLADSPCALVTSKFGWSAYQERIMRSQVGRSIPFRCAPNARHSSVLAFGIHAREMGATRRSCMHPCASDSEESGEAADSASGESGEATGQRLPVNACKWVLLLAV